MTDSAINHLRQDPILTSILDRYTLKPFKPSQNYFSDLVKIITNQQLSTKAGQSILNRLQNLLNLPTIHHLQPHHLTNLTESDLRSLGYSHQKTSYLYSLSNSVLSNHIKLDQINHLSDNDVKTEITQIKGLGPWSADMFLIFSLNRPDIFSLGDLGLRVAVSRLYQINKEDHKKILSISQKWSPYRTTASRYLWLSLENQ